MISSFQGLCRGGCEHHQYTCHQRKSQEQKEEEQVEELASNHDEAGQNTLAMPSHTVVDIALGVVPQGELSDFVMLYNDLQDAVLRQSYKEHKHMRILDKFECGEVSEERAHNTEVAQDIVNFKEKLAREEANFKLPTDPEARGVSVGTPWPRSQL